MSAYSLPDLPYDYAALEPHFDAKTLEIHHKQVHARCVERLNAVIDSSDELRAAGGQTIDDLLWHIGKIPEESRNAIRNFGGGHANHSLFWESLSPDGGDGPTGDLATAIDQEFGSLDAFKQVFSRVALNHFGSGWAWLVLTRRRLIVYSLPNEDSPLTAEEVPLLNLDLWEHAYYLHYPDDRKGYVEAFWNIVNWPAVSRRYEEAMRR